MKDENHLTGRVLASIPTPTVQDGKNNAGPSQHERNSLPLNTWVVQNPWPTPRASESEMRTYKRPESHANGTHGKHLQVEVLEDHGVTNGTMKLHGRWTLALQGFPPTWCDDLGPTEAGSTDFPASSLPSTTAGKS